MSTLRYWMWRVNITSLDVSGRPYSELANREHLFSCHSQSKQGITNKQGIRLTPSSELRTLNSMQSLCPRYSIRRYQLASTARTKLINESLTKVRHTCLEGIWEEPNTSFLSSLIRISPQSAWSGDSYAGTASTLMYVTLANREQTKTGKHTQEKNRSGTNIHEEIKQAVPYLPTEAIHRLFRTALVLCWKSN